MEYRNQWQRRNFKVEAYAVTGGDDANITGLADPSGSNMTHFLIYVDYDNKGKVTKSSVKADEASFVGYAQFS